MEREKERLINIRSEFRALAAEFPDIMDAEPKLWYPGVARKLLTLKQSLHALPHETQEFLSPILLEGEKALREETVFSKSLHPEEISDELRGLRAESHLMNLSREMALRHEHDVAPVKEHIVPIDELLTRFPDKVRLQRERDIQLFGVRHPYTQEWYDIPMPLSDTMWHKGGAARMVMNIYAGAPKRMLAAEIPVNDLDVVFVGDENEARKDAAKIGVDPDGVEVAGEEIFDFTKFCYGRDTTQNQICFGNDGLHFSKYALDAAKTGHTEIIGKYIANKAIYGVDQFKHDEGELIKPRGLMRLIKVVSEGKALSFSYKPLNQNLDVGLYWIFLAKKWSKRSDFGILLQRMYELGKRMDQTREDEHSVQDLLVRAHTEFPFFDVDKQINDIVDVVRWKSRKFAKQLDREFSWSYSIPAGILYQREANDNIPTRIHLDGFTPSEKKARQIEAWWPEYAEQCRERFAAYERLGINPVDRLFFDLDTELPPETLDE